MKRFLAIIFSITIGGAPVISSAAAIDVPTPATAKTAKDWAAILGPKSLAAAMSECIASIKTSGQITSITLANGVRVDTVKLADGTVKSITMFDVKGVAQQTVNAATTAVTDKLGVPSYVARDDSYQAMKRIAKDALLTSLMNQCRAMAVTKAASATTKGAATTNLFNVGCGGSGGMDDDDGFAAGDCNAGNSGGGGGGAAESDASDGGLIADLVDDDYSAEQTAYAAAAESAPKQKCAVVVSQCRDTCTTWGQYYVGACITVGTGISWKFKAPGVIFIVGCTGDATAWMEHCRRDCNTPTVPCE